MKIFARLAVAAGLVVAAGCANAQMLAPNGAGRANVQAASDFEEPGPYYGPPPVPPAPPPRPYGYVPDNGYGPRYGEGPRYGDAPPYGYGPRYGYGPELMSLPNVYAVLRENGFSPLGIPHQRGFVYVIGAIDRAGQDGRLVIDGRSGQIIRFMPAYRWGGPLDRMRFEPGLPPSPYGRQAALPPPTVIRGAPQQQAPVPPLASHAVPVPAPKPVTTAKPAQGSVQGSVQGSQQSAAVETKPPQAPPAQTAATQPQAPQAAAASPQPNATVAQSKPAPQILPTQEMPKAQGLE
jgi:hypothetical protein